LKLAGARVTRDRHLLPAVVVVRDRKMKEAWCRHVAQGRARVGDRQELRQAPSIEETFRDTKDLHFGMGLSATHIGSAKRRDRLLLLAAIAHSLLSLLGAASDAGPGCGLQWYRRTRGRPRSPAAAGAADGLAVRSGACSRSSCLE
jgi:hypothetical protein